MLAAQTVELSREEIVEMIEAICDHARRDAGEAIRDYRRGVNLDFQHLAEAYGLSDLLPDDDPIFGA